MGSGSAKPDGKGCGKKRAKDWGHLHSRAHSKRNLSKWHSSLMLTSNLNFCLKMGFFRTSHFILGMSLKMTQSEALQWTSIIANNEFLITKIALNDLFLITVFIPKSVLNLCLSQQSSGGHCKWCRTVVQLPSTEPPLCRKGPCAEAETSSDRPQMVVS